MAKGRTVRFCFRASQNMLAAVSELYKMVQAKLERILSKTIKWVEEEREKKGVCPLASIYSIETEKGLSRKCIGLGTNPNCEYLGKEMQDPESRKPFKIRICNYKPQ